MSPPNGFGHLFLWNDAKAMLCGDILELHCRTCLPYTGGRINPALHSESPADLSRGDHIRCPSISSIGHPDGYGFGISH